MLYLAYLSDVDAGLLNGLEVAVFDLLYVGYYLIVIIGEGLFFMLGMIDRLRWGEMIFLCMMILMILRNGLDLWVGVVFSFLCVRIDW